MTDDIKKRVEDLRARARAAISEEATDALNAAADTLEAEHQRAETLEANRAAWTGDAFELVQKAEAERDALRTAIQDALRDLWAVPMSATKEARRTLSRAIDTKDKTDEPA
jgi:formiminotetrahydrofolate cyclodeaminase